MFENIVTVSTGDDSSIDWSVVLVKTKLCCPAEIATFHQGCAASALNSRPALKSPQIS